MTRRTTLIATIAVALTVACPALATDYVWWEGEKPARTNFPARSWFSASNVPAAGAYHLWARKFWKHGPFRWRFDTGDWRTCGRDVALADSVEIRTHLCVNWVYLGKVTLTAGRHDFELRLLAGPGENLTACFDCFLLTPRVFQPRGKLRPGQRSGAADEGFFAYECWTCEV